MKHKLSRRKFSQLTLSGTAAVTASILLGSMGSKALATKSERQFLHNDNVLYGVRAGAISGGVQILSLDLTTGEVKNLSELARTITLDSSTYLVSFNALRNGGLILAGNSVKNIEDDKQSRLIVLGNSSEIASQSSKNSNSTSLLVASRSKVSGANSSGLTISGLGKDRKVESLLVTKEDKLIALVGRNKAQPPFQLVEINIETGGITDISFSLPKEYRFSTLTQSRDGTIYASCVQIDTGDTRLVQLDLQQRLLKYLPQLCIERTLWQSGIRSLACSSKGQFYALASHMHSPVNTLYTVHPNTGAMKVIREFAVNKITFAYS